MEKKENEVYLPNVDSLFSSQKGREIMQSEVVKKISISDIDNFPNHPFRVNVSKEDEIYSSIEQMGVTTPIIVRPKDNGRYELISGHRRKMVSEMLGLDTIPCIVKNLSDDEATILMVDCNFQREKILPSEKAFAYKLKLKALIHQGKGTSRPMVDKLKSVDIVGKDNNESGRQVHRYIRLTELIPEILSMVDNDVLKLSPSIAFRPAVELSYLTKDEQKNLLDFMQCYDCTPSLAQAIKLKNRSQSGTLTVDYMEELLSEDKPNQIPKIKVSIERLVLPDYLQDDKQREDYIVKAVNFYDKYQKKKREREESR